jgi:plastocyanin
VPAQAKSMATAHGDGQADVAGTSFGVPGEPREGDKASRVAALDSLEFDPEDVRVSRGDTVTLRLNSWSLASHMNFFPLQAV